LFVEEFRIGSDSVSVFVRTELDFLCGARKHFVSDIFCRTCLTWSVTAQNGMGAGQMSVFPLYILSSLEYQATAV
jgi:hypothetical protein